MTCNGTKRINTDEQVGIIRHRTSAPCPGCPDCKDTTSDVEEMVREGCERCGSTSHTKFEQDSSCLSSCTKPEEEWWEKDELYDEALTFLKRGNGLKVSELQRRLKVGYARASRLMDLLHEAGEMEVFRGEGRRSARIEPTPPPSSDRERVDASMVFHLNQYEKESGKGIERILSLLASERLRIIEECVEKVGKDCPLKNNDRCINGTCWHQEAITALNKMKGDKGGGMI